MSQRASGYRRIPHDRYVTPAWPVEALLPHLPRDITIWEPAAGPGAMVEVLRNSGYEVIASDIADGNDFLKAMAEEADAIITNPPYHQAQAFIEHALRLVKPRCGMVAMLLRTDYDHAKSRHHLFGGCAAFAKKIALTKRIVWFEDGRGSPSFNHAWFIWNWHHAGPPVLAYEPQRVPQAQQLAMELS